MILRCSVCKIVYGTMPPWKDARQHDGCCPICRNKPKPELKNLVQLMAIRKGVIARVVKR